MIPPRHLDRPQADRRLAGRRARLEGASSPTRSANVSAARATAAGLALDDDRRIGERERGRGSPPATATSRVGAREPLGEYLPISRCDVVSVSGCLDADGEPLAVGVSRELAQWPPGVGGSSASPVGRAASRGSGAWSAGCATRASGRCSSGTTSPRRSPSSRWACATPVGWSSRSWRRRGPRRSRPRLTAQVAAGRLDAAAAG